MTRDISTFHGRGVLRALAAGALLALLLVAALGSPPAVKGAKAPEWVETGHSQIPFEYFQGVTSDRQRNLYFDGFFSGLYRTDSALHEEARNFNAIPFDVFTREGYNHIGDITWDSGEGGRVLLPLECFIFRNTCFTGSIGVADDDTLQWRYYVKLDPAFIDKAMWAEVSPNGKLLWTSSGSGKDLLAYDMSEITEANAAPNGPLLKPVRRLIGKVPPSGITGATFYKHRLLVAGQDTGPFQIWSIDLNDGSRRLELQKSVLGESEGLDISKVLRGVLHWQITPFKTGGKPPTYSDFEHSALVHFHQAHGGIGPQT